MSSRTPLKIIGKEFLYNENLFVNNYNPFATGNNIQDINLDKTVQGRIYLFDKTNWIEPTKEQFKQIKTINSFTVDSTYKKPENLTKARINYYPISLIFKVIFVDSVPTKTIEINNENSILNIEPNIDSSQSVSIFDSCFAIIVVDNDTTNTNTKAYTDLSVAEQSFMWMIQNVDIETILEDATPDTQKTLTFKLTNPAKKDILVNNFTYPGKTFKEATGITTGKEVDDVYMDISRPFRYQFKSKPGVTVPDNLLGSSWELFNFPDYSGWAYFVVAKDYVYKFNIYNAAGASSTITNNIHRAKLDSDGNISSVPSGEQWELIGNAPIYGNKPLIIKNKIYLIGGVNSSGAYLKSCYFATINDDGSLSTWTPLADLMYPYSGQAVVVNNKIYVFGGHDGTNYLKYSQIGHLDSNGNITKWTNSQIYFPATFGSGHTINYGNTIFILPGYDRTSAAYTNLIWKTTVMPNGELSPFEVEYSATGLTNAYVSASCILGNKLYIIGGWNTTVSAYTNIISVADITMVNGVPTIGAFRSGGTFPISKHGDGVFITKKYLYIAAGREGTSTWSNSIKYYKLDISDYVVGKNDYTLDTYTERTIVPLPVANDVSEFDSVDVSFNMGYYKDISDPDNLIVFSDIERLDIAKEISVNGIKIGSLPNFGVDDIIIPTLNETEILAAETNPDTYQITVSIKSSFLNINKFRLYDSTEMEIKDPYEINTVLLINVSKDADTTKDHLYDKSGKQFISLEGGPTGLGVGLAPTINTETKRFGKGSIYLDGTTYGRILNRNSFYNHLNGENFTIECQFNLETLPEATKQSSIISKWGGGLTGYNSRSFDIRINDNGSIQFHISIDGINELVSSISEANTITTDTWYHMAFVREGLKLNLYINGSKVCDYTIGTSVISVGYHVPLLIGASNSVSMNYDGSQRRFKGFIDDIRITTGICRYLEVELSQNPGIIPSKSLELMDEYELEDTVNIYEITDDGHNRSLYWKTSAAYNFNNTSRDLGGGSHGSTSAIAFVYAIKRFGTESAYFNGSTSYFQPANIQCSGDFTISFWLMIPAAITTTQCVFTRYAGSSSAAADMFGLFINTNRELFWTNEYIRDNYVTMWGTKPLEIGKWHHILITKKDVVTKFWVDGDANSTLATSNWNIGSAANTSWPLRFASKYITGTSYVPFKGYVDQCRLFGAHVLDEKTIQSLFLEKRYKRKGLKTNKVPVIDVVSNDVGHVNLNAVKTNYSTPEEFYRYNLDIVPGGTSLFEVQTISPAHSFGVTFSTGKKVYLFGGRSDNSASTSLVYSNTMWVSNILNDGSLEGFTQVGTNPLNGNVYVNTYTYMKPDYTDTDTVIGWVYFLGGFSGTFSAYNTSNLIRRAEILQDGSIGSIENHGTMPYKVFATSLTIHPENPNVFYMVLSYGYTNTVSDFTVVSKIAKCKIDTNGNLTMDIDDIYTTDINGSFNATRIIKDPKDGFWYMLIFGQIDSEADSNIYKLKIDKDYNIISNPISCGTMYKPFQDQMILEDFENIYLIGGVASVAPNVYGASNFVQKFSKTDLLNDSLYIGAQYTLMPALPFALSAGFNVIDTQYATYIITPKTTTVTNGSSWNWQPSGRIIGFKKNWVDTGSNSINLNRLDINQTKLNNIVPNKLNTRIKEELFSNLLVKTSRSLMAFGETIKFKDPSDPTNTIVTLVEMNRAALIGEKEAKFLEWIKALSKDTKLDKYNPYLYTNLFGQNTSRKYDLIIPELILDIICTKGMYNISKKIFEEYLISNAPSTYDIDITSLDFDISKILIVFYKQQSTSSTTTSVTYTTNGIQLPKHDTFGVNSQVNESRYIFNPQRHNKKSILPSTIPPRPKGSDYIDNVGSCLYTKKIEEALIDYKPENAEILAYFNYYVSPTGDNANDGLTPYTPKATVGGCPAGTKVLLLPGTYNGWSSTSSQSRCPSVLVGLTTHQVWGCGASTIIDVPIDINGLGMEVSVIPKTATGTGTLNNLDVIWRANYEVVGTVGANHSYVQVTNSNGFTCYRVNFKNQPGSYYTIATRSYLTAGTFAAYFNNCTISGGTYRAGYYGNFQVYNTITDAPIYTTLETPNLDLSNKGYIDNINDTIEFTPMYTLIPLSDDDEPDSNSIILEMTNNITSIPNLSFRL